MQIIAAPNIVQNCKILPEAIFQFLSSHQTHIPDLFSLILIYLLFATRATNNYTLYKDKQTNGRIMIAQRWHIFLTFATCQICIF